MNQQPYTFGDVMPIFLLPFEGLGTTPTGSASLITGAGSAVAGAINSTSTAGEIGSAITAGFDVAALASGPAAPIVAAIGNILGPIISMFKGCGSTCTQATTIANQAGAAMAQAFQAYMSAPVHYYSAQQNFLAYCNTLFAQLKSACGNPALGSAGQACIEENTDPTACHWTASPGGWNQNADGTWTYTYWGAAGSGTACWNPIVGIYNEVLNDPTVVADPVQAASSSTTPGSTLTTSPTTGLLSTSSSPDPTSSLLVLAVVGILAAFILL